MLQKLFLFLLVPVLCIYHFSKLIVIPFSGNYRKVERVSFDHFPKAFDSHPFNENGWFACSGLWLAAKSMTRLIKVGEGMININKQGHPWYNFRFFDCLEPVLFVSCQAKRDFQQVAWYQFGCSETPGKSEIHESGYLENFWLMLSDEKISNLQLSTRETFITGHYYQELWFASLGQTSPACKKPFLLGSSGKCPSPKCNSPIPSSPSGSWHGSWTTGTYASLDDFFSVISDGSLFVLAESVIQKASLFCIVFIYVFFGGRWNDKPLSVLISWQDMSISERKEKANESEWVEFFDSTNCDFGDMSCSKQIPFPQKPQRKTYGWFLLGEWFSYAMGRWCATSFLGRFHIIFIFLPPSPEPWGKDPNSTSIHFRWVEHHQLGWNVNINRLSFVRLIYPRKTHHLGEVMNPLWLWWAYASKGGWKTNLDPLLGCQIDES